MLEIPKLSHLSISPRKGNGPHQGQRKTLIRVGFGDQNPKVMGLNATLVRVFLFPCAGHFSDGITWKFQALQFTLKNYLDHPSSSAARPMFNMYSSITCFYTMK